MRYVGSIEDRWFAGPIWGKRGSILNSPCASNVAFKHFSCNFCLTPLLTVSAPPFRHRAPVPVFLTNALLLVGVVKKRQAIIALVSGG